VEPSVERRRPQGYGLALLLVIATILTFAIVGDGWVGTVVAVAITGLTLLVVLHSSAVSARRMRLARAVVAAALVVAALSAIGSSEPGRALQLLIGLLLAFACPIVIFRRLLRAERIDLPMVAGALCIYLLAGLMFAFVFGIIDVMQSDPFFVQENHPNGVDFIYFSFTNLATLGYGDLTARADVGRLVAVTEALSGQLYLVTAVALLVSNLGKERSPRTPPTSG